MTTNKEKRAVLKLAGFELMRTHAKQYDWVVESDDRMNTLYRSNWSYKTPTLAWESAWQFIQGDASLEMDGDAWGTI